MCASRSDRQPSWRRRALGGGLVLLLALAGCFAVIRTAEEGRFPHALHSAELECTDCHEGATDSAKAGLPDPEACSDCHDPEDPEDAGRSGLIAYGEGHTAGRWPSAAVHGPTYGDVIFKHDKHAAAGVTCDKCHDGAKSGVVPNPGGPLDMDTCEDCHEERGASTECETCHEELSRKERPKTHLPRDAWILYHGSMSRNPDRSIVVERCELCHTRSSCDACHAVDKPADHTEAFRVSTHGLKASMDRSRCMACHQADSCDRCHQTLPPRTHRAGWGAPRNRHCFTCHLPASGESCTVCHKGMPSHSMAPPKPPAHNPGRDCRQCHPRHPDNGQDCSLCHR